MAKRKQVRVIDVSKPIPEWGLSEVVSRAVPIVVSGPEIRSTRDISRGIQMELHKHFEGTDVLRQARNLVATAKRKRRSKAVFRNDDVIFE